MPRRLALILSGAVSLGNFEAGVLTEILYLLDHLSKTDSPQKCELDIIAGASAGSVTGAIVAYVAAQNPGAVDTLRKVWVDEISMEALLAIPATKSLFSSKITENIADRYIVNPQAQSKAQYAAEDISLLFTLSNLNGLDRRMFLRPGGPAKNDFVTTFFADKVRFQLQSAKPFNLAAWKPILNAAVASGSFPIAFEPVILKRDRGDFADHQIDPFPEGDQFAYVDGGMFNNEPIGAAIDEVMRRYGPNINDDRIFLLVDADLNASSYKPKIGSNTGFVETAARLIGMIYQEAKASDWSRAQLTNVQIRWREDLIPRLAAVIKASTLTDQGKGFLEALETEAREMLTLKAETKPGSPGPEALEALLNGIEQRHPNEIATLVQVVKNPDGAPVKNPDGTLVTIPDIERRRAFDLILFTLDNIANLSNKSSLNIHAIYTREEQAKGKLLYAFGGFFLKEWREYDYKLGRSIARDALPEVFAIKGYPEDPMFAGNYLTKAQREPRQDVSMQTVPEDLRIRVRDKALKNLMDVVWSLMVERDKEQKKTQSEAEDKAAKSRSTLASIAHFLGGPARFAGDKINQAKRNLASTAIESVARDQLNTLLELPS